MTHPIEHREKYNNVTWHDRPALSASGSGPLFNRAHVAKIVSLIAFFAVAFAAGLYLAGHPALPTCAGSSNCGTIAHH